MPTLKESAKAYEPPQTLNVADLDFISVDVEVTTEKHQDKEGKEFEVNVCEVEGKKYRIPNSVLEQLKMILGKFDDTKYVTVGKTGTGLATKYTVMPHTGKVKEEKIED